MLTSRSNLLPAVTARGSWRDRNSHEHLTIALSAEVVGHRHTSTSSPSHSFSPFPSTPLLFFPVYTGIEAMGSLMLSKCSPLSYPHNFLFTLFSETGSHYVVQASLDL